MQAEAASGFLLAGERAASLDACRATGYFRRALELMTAEHPQRPRAASRAAEMAEARGDYIEGEQLYVAAITGTVHYLWAVKKDTFFPLVYLAVFAFLLGFRVIFARRKPSPAPRTQSGATAPA